MADALAKIKKGGKDASEGFFMINKNMKNYQDQMTAVTKAKGKSGKALDNQTRDIIAGMFGNISADDIKQMTSKELDNLLQGTEEAINQAFTDDLQSVLDNAVNSNPEINLDQLSVGVNGEIDLSQLYAICDAAGQDAINAILAQAGEYGEVIFHAVKTADGGRVYATVNTKGKNSYNSKGNGGGGGGKSDVDKLLEEQKFKVAQAEHESKMLQIEEKGHQYNNDYDAWTRNIDDQIQAQYKLRDLYADNIKEMEDMLQKVKEGSDDYKKLVEALNSATESYKDLINTIHDLQATQRMNILDEELEDKSKFSVHVGNMLKSYADRALNNDQFNDYVAYMTQSILNTQEQRNFNAFSIERWKQQLAEVELETDENGEVLYNDTWKEIQSKIYDLEEQNAQLDAQIAQDVVSLNEQKLSQVAKALQQNTSTANYNLGIAQAYGGTYQTGGYRNEYEDMLRVQIDATKELIDENTTARKSAQELMAELEASGKQGTTQWFNALSAVYEYDTAIAQAKVSTIEYNRALAESNLERISEEYSDITRDLTHVNDLLKQQADIYLSHRDYDSYLEATQKWIDNQSQVVEQNEVSLYNLRQLYEEGMAAETLDPAMQRAILDQINEAETRLIQDMNKLEKAQRELDKNKLDRLIEQQDWAS